MLSVVIPCHNESDVLDHLTARLRPVLDGIAEPYEVVFVDDGSTDATLVGLYRLAEAWPAIRIVELVRNSGHQAAITAGIDAARGDFVVTIDADLQDPPELIPEMLMAARAEGVDVVYARRSNRSSDTVLKRNTARLYYLLIRRATGIDMVPNAGDYRLISRRVADVLRSLPERRRVYRLLVPWLGFPSTTVEHVRHERVAGESKYTVRKMFGLALDSLASFSTGPLHFATFIGFVTGVASLIATVIVIALHAVGHTIPGWASMSAAIFFLGSVQLICLGLLGSYVGRIYEEVRHRPLYIARQNAYSSTPLETELPGSPVEDLSPIGDAR